LEQEFLEDLVKRLQRMGLTYAITGSIASNYWGVPRLTHDVDVLVVLHAAAVTQVVEAFADAYYVSEKAVRQALLSRSMFNVLDTSSGLKADLWISPDDPFSQSMLIRRQKVELLPGVEAYIGSPEDVLLHKLVWHKITPSERQLRDAAGIAVVQSGKLDLDYLRSWAAKQSTLDVLEEVLQGNGLKQS
jgi:hypothetical protein